VATLVPGRERWREVVEVAPERRERRRSAQQYEQELKRHELAAARALVQVLPTDRPAAARDLAAARRALTQALFDLRRLGRELDHDLEQLQARQPGPTRPPASGQPGRRAPEEVYRLEAARNAIDEVLERWENRRTQLGEELERRGGQRANARRRAQPAPPARRGAKGRRRTG
jgi:hypothetical protein